MNAHLYAVPSGAEQKTFDNPLQIAKFLQPEHPVQCFSANALVQQIKQFKDNFPGKVSYAIKANPSPIVLKTAALSGLDIFDVASINEMEQVRAIAPKARLHYHNPVRSREEVRLALQKYQCTRYSVDELSELKKLIETITLTDIKPQDIEIAVRFRLPASGKSVHDFSEKFGLAPQDASHLLAQVKLCGFIPVLTFHPGSQCLDPASWDQHITTAAEIARKANVILTKLNVGGGFPVDYASHRAPDLKQFFSMIATATGAAFSKQKTPALECEPGRAIVAPSTSVLTRVKLVREANNEVFLNDGIYGNLMEASQAADLQPEARLIRNGHYHMANLKPHIIYGPTCDPLDRLPAPIMLPDDIAEDDYVEFQQLGAYGNATSTYFNGYGHSQVIQVRYL